MLCLLADLWSATRTTDRVEDPDDEQPQTLAAAMGMAEAARAALGVDTFHVVADAGYSNGEQAAACEAAGMLHHVSATRTVNPNGNGTLFQRTDFHYQPETDTYLCPGDKTLRRRALHRKDKRTEYEADTKDCGMCPLKSQCTYSARRTIARHTL